MADIFGEKIMQIHIFTCEVSNVFGYSEHEYIFYKKNRSNHFANMAAKFKMAVMNSEDGHTCVLQQSLFDRHSLWFCDKKDVMVSKRPA